MSHKLCLGDITDFLANALFLVRTVCYLAIKNRVVYAMITHSIFTSL